MQKKSTKSSAYEVTNKTPLCRPAGQRPMTGNTAACDLKTRYYLGVRVSGETYDKIAKKANRERRSLASMCELLLIQGTATEILE